MTNLINRIRRRTKGTGAWFEFFLMLMVFPIMLAGLGAGILMINVYAGIALASVVLLLSALLMIWTTLNPDANEAESEGITGIHPLLEFDVTLTGIYCAAFAVLSMGLWKLWGIDAFVGFEPVGNAKEIVSWLRYALDNVVRAALLDFAETYYIDVSPIRHADNFRMNSIVFGMRTIVSITFISIYIELLMAIRKRLARNFS